MSDSENTQPKRVIGVPFKPGNPGRPKGSKNKLGEAFVEALHDDFKEHGVTAIQTVRAEDPSAYLKVIAAVVPKDLNVKHDAFDGLSDDQLAFIIAAARSALGFVDGGPEAPGATAH